MHETRGEARGGPWLVALGAALWGTEIAWRPALMKRLGDADVLVFWEHVLLVLIALPVVLPRLGELRNVKRSTFAWLVFSGIAGSALGAVLYTLAITDHNGSVVNVVLNVQPLFSTLGAVLLLGDRVATSVPAWATLAVGAAMVVAGLGPDFAFTFDAGIGFALLTALAWGMSTVAGRVVMVEMSLPLAAGLRVIIGLVAMTALLAVRGLLTLDALWPAEARAHIAETSLTLVALATVSGWIPLLVYFRGLSLTRASTAGFMEMFQTVTAVGISWAVQGNALEWWQVIAAVVLMFAVAMVQRAQGRLAAR